VKKSSREGNCCRASREVALAPSAAAPLGDLWPFDLDFRLYRRVVEIRDAQLVLRPYLDADTVAEANVTGSANVATTW